MTMRASIILSIVLLSETSLGSSRTLYRPHPTFINHNIYTDVKARPSTIMATKSDDTLLDAEEAAAIDAHDVSDAGVEGAAMERAVIMAEEFKEEQQKKTDVEHDMTSFFNKSKTLLRDFMRRKLNRDMMKVEDVEAKFAHDLSDIAAMEHANEVVLLDGEDDDIVNDISLFDAEEAAALDAHDVSDAGVEGAAMERAVIMAAEFKKQQQKEKEDDIMKIRDAEAKFAHDLSDLAAVDHAKDYTNVDGESRIASLAIASVEEHYRSIDKDIKTIEHLIEEAAKADQSQGHTLERTFSDDDASDLALMMLEKSVIAATDKLEICQSKAENTENEVRVALEEKYSAKAVAESIERERRAAEMRFLSTEHFCDDGDVMERARDSSIIHSNNELLADALKQERDAELKLEDAIEHDIAAKKELEQMIENKSMLKQELHDLEKIVHQHNLALWEKEKASESKKKGWHHFDWWHRKW